MINQKIEEVNVDKELSNYFKTKKGFERLFKELKNKYISIGRYSGTVKLNKLTKDESTDLTNFFGKTFKERDDYKISFRDIEKKILQTKYKDFTFDGLFLYYFGKRIDTKKEIKEASINSEKYFWNEIYAENIKNEYVKYMKNIVDSNDEVYKMIKRIYKDNMQNAKKIVNSTLLLLNNIPSKEMSLPVYASITGNPHFLDFGTTSSNIFLRILSYIKKFEYENTNEFRVNILSEINVYIDPVSNYVITYKLIGNEMLDSFDKNDEILNLNLENIINFSNVDTACKKVYIFENPSILNTLKNLSVPMVVISGMPNLSCYKLLSKLIESGNSLYYNGDFDPEGLIIAKKLKDKYSNLNIFCYGKDDYELAKTDEHINEHRIKKLDKIDTPELQQIKKIIIKTQHAGFQERNIKNIKEYIIKNK